MDRPHPHLNINALDCISDSLVPLWHELGRQRQIPVGQGANAIRGLLGKDGNTGSVALSRIEQPPVASASERCGEPLTANRNLAHWRNDATIQLRMNAQELAQAAHRILVAWNTGRRLADVDVQELQIAFPAFARCRAEDLACLVIHELNSGVLEDDCGER